MAGAPPPAASVSVPPPEAFAQLGSRLKRAEIEACLVALGMRKGVLLLAIDPLSQMEADADDSYALDGWWGGLHARSRIVVESKMRSFGASVPVLFALTCACLGLCDKVVLSSLPPVPTFELREVLSVFKEDYDAIDVDAMLGGSGETVQIAAWTAALSDEAREQLSCAVRDVAPAATAARVDSGATRAEMQALEPGEAPEETRRSEAEAARRSSSEEIGVPDFDPLANCEGVRNSEYESAS